MAVPDLQTQFRPLLELLEAGMIDFSHGVAASHRYALKRLDPDYFVTDGWYPPASEPWPGHSHTPSQSRCQRIVRF